MWGIRSVSWGSTSLDAPLLLILLLASAVQVNALPSYYDWYKLCNIPQKGYKHHGAPLRSEHVTFSLEDSSGALATSWQPGETYILRTSSAIGEEVQAFVHASIGVLDAETMASKTGFQSNSCENAWGSMKASKSHKMTWLAPSSVPSGGLCVVFAAAQATSSKSAYQTNSVEVCSEGSNAWAISYNYGGRHLQWSHAIWLVVGCSALLVGSVMITKPSRDHPRGVRSSLIEPA